jgi:hypothetical protein
MKSFRDALDLSKTERRELLYLALALGMAFALCMFGNYLIAPFINPWVKIACGLVGVFGAIAFVRADSEVGVPSKWKHSHLLTILAAIFLGVLTWFAFYKPMTMHFWIGYDEPVLLSINTMWFDTYEKCCARPLAGLEAFLGNILMPGEIESLPIATAVARWLLAVAIFLFVKTLVPEAKLFAVAAGALMVVNPTETLRFSPGLSLPYGGALAFFFAASFAYVLSYRTASKGLLLLSCLLLGVAFLHYETILPISVLVPPLVWFLLPQGQRRLWPIAWYLTVAAAAARFLLLFLISLAVRGPMYQSGYARRFTLPALLENFPLLLKPILKFVSPLYSGAMISLPPIAIGAGTLVAFLVLGKLFPLRAELVAYRRKIALVGTAALVGVLFAILPEVSVVTLLREIPNFDGGLTSRLEFSPGPFQAILWAAVIAWATSFLPRPEWFFATGIAVVVALSCLDSWQLQAENGPINRHLDFQTESNIFRAAAATITQSPPDSVIFFAIPDDQPSALGFGYHPFHMSCLLFGRPAYAGHYSPDLGLRWRMTAFPSPLDRPDNYFLLPETKNIVLFSVSRDGSVTEIARDMTTSGAATSQTMKTNSMGLCSIPAAPLRANGDLPFLLPAK